MTAPIASDPKAMPAEVTPNALCSRWAARVPFWSGWATAPCALRHISSPTNVETARAMNKKKKTRNPVSTVRIAAASIDVNAISVRKR